MRSAPSGFFKRILPLCLLLGLWACPDDGSDSGRPTDPSPPVPTNRYVALTGNDANNNCANQNLPCRTIQVAHNASANGDTIFVAPGTYAQSVVLTASVRIRGMGTTPRAVLLQGTISTTSANVDVANLGLEPPAGQSGLVNGFELRRVLGSEIGLDQIDVRNFSGHGIHIDGNGGSVSIRQTYVTGNLDGIRVDGGGQVFLSFIRAEANRGDGIQFSNVAASTNQQWISNINADRLFLFLNGESGFQVEAMTSTPLTFQSSCVLENNAEGINLQFILNSQVRIDSSNIEGNDLGGASIVASNVTPNMTGNFWGAGNGPSGAGPGGGDSVTAGILFSPWSATRLPALTSTGCS